MYTLKGIFPEPKKDQDQKKNFIRENMKQLKYLQGKIHNQPKLPVRKCPPSIQTITGKSSHNFIKSPTLRKGVQNSRKKHDVQIKKGDMAEFLKRKDMRRMAQEEESVPDDDDLNSTASSGHLKDIACQTVESNLAQSFADGAKLTILYPKKEEESESTLKASGDMGRHKSEPHGVTPRRSGDSDLFEAEKRSRLNAILERKDNKDPYLPSGYQKGVLPKYLRERKELDLKSEEAAVEETAVCPAGHVTLPDVERKETLRMLRNSFAELVSELNKMPVKTDTLRMRNRKMELEKQLAKLEEGIKVFSRPKVFVKIGE